MSASTSCCRVRHENDGTLIAVGWSSTMCGRKSTSCACSVGVRGDWICARKDSAACTRCCPSSQRCWYADRHANASRHHPSSRTIPRWYHLLVLSRKKTTERNEKTYGHRAVMVQQPVKGAPEVWESMGQLRNPDAGIGSPKSGPGLLHQLLVICNIAMHQTQPQHRGSSSRSVHLCDQRFRLLVPSLRSLPLLTSVYCTHTQHRVLPSCSRLCVLVPR